MSSPRDPSRLTMHRQFEKVDGVVIIETEAITLHRGDTSPTVEKLLMEDGRELFGCRKCSAVAAAVASMNSHQRRHAYEEGRARTRQKPRHTDNGNGSSPPPVVLVRRPRDIDVIAAEIVAARAHCREVEAEMGAALGLNDEWGRGPGPAP